MTRKPMNRYVYKVGTGRGWVGLDIWEYLHARRLKLPFERGGGGLK